MKRCPWSESTEMMREYHDTIWGDLNMKINDCTVN